MSNRFINNCWVKKLFHRITVNPIFRLDAARSASEFHCQKIDNEADTDKMQDKS